MVYTVTEFDGRAVDVWACGVIYMYMQLFRHLWYFVKDDDEYYVEGRRAEAGFTPASPLELVGIANS
ncbi:HAL protein kinase [Apiospora arundinis]